MNKKLISFCMSVVMAFSTVLPCFAAEQSELILFSDEVQTEFDETNQIYETELSDEVNVMADEVVLDESVSDESVLDEDTSLNEAQFEEDESCFTDEFLSAASTKDLTDALKTVQESTKTLSDGQEAVSTLSNAFNSFMNVASTASTILSVVNGSVAVLRLIGVVEDPTQKKLDTISEQIGRLDEKVTALAKSISDLSDSMTKLSADVGLNARASHAATLQQNWNSFNTNYVDNGMKRLITQYESEIRDRVHAWCVSTPENAQIVIKYKKVNNSYEPVYGKNVSSDATVTLSRECLPSSITWNVDTYSYDVAQAIKTSLSENLTKASCTGEFTVTTDNVGDVANDAVNALLYDISVDAVNDKGSAFALQVRDAYANYCKYLTTVKETGVSAMIQSMYQTHAFESQTKKILFLSMTR